METLSPNCLCASSTEGASKLHVPQPGAQNHKAIGIAVGPRVRSIDPPPISEYASVAWFGVDSSTDVVVATTTVVDTSSLLLEELHPASDTTPTNTETINFFMSITLPTEMLWLEQCLWEELLWERPW